jgi:predicted DCC family thiol-disulfide oxidoreductase YuxK
VLEKYTEQNRGNRECCNAEDRGHATSAGVDSVLERVNATWTVATCARIFVELIYDAAYAMVMLTR